MTSSPEDVTCASSPEDVTRFLNSPEGVLKADNNPEGVFPTSSPEGVTSVPGEPKGATRMSGPKGATRVSASIPVGVTVCCRGFWHVRGQRASVRVMARRKVSRSCAAALSTSRSLLRCSSIAIHR